MGRNLKVPVDVSDAEGDAFERVEQERREKLSRVAAVACPDPDLALPKLNLDGSLTDQIRYQWERGEPVTEIAEAVQRTQGFVAGVVNRHEAEKAGLGGSYCANVPYAEFLKSCDSEKEDR